MIELVHFSKRDLYNNFNLKIDKGITLLKGRNGSGKTTLLDCIADLDKKYKGTIKGNENSVYLNQNLYFSGRLNASDFVKFTMNLAGIKNAQEYYFSKVKKYENEFNFYDLWNKKISFLSGGELKMLFFSVISSLEREIYIFDEPYAGVDTYGKNIMNRILMNLNELQKIILITSHEEECVNELNNVRIVNLDQE